MKTSKISLVAVLALTLTLGLAASSMGPSRRRHGRPWRRHGMRHDGRYEPHPRSGRQVL